MTTTWKPTDRDRAQLARLGISEDEARRQLALLARPRAWAPVVRPCTFGDGVVVVEDAAADELVRLAGDDARAPGRLKFVPASGAATRMFRELAALRNGRLPDDWGAVERAAAAGDDDVRPLLELRAGLARVPFADELERTLGRPVGTASPVEILEGLLSPGRLGYADLPKGLLPFHRYEGGSRTAFEEHLVEAAQYGRGSGGRCRLHFTVSPEHQERFEALLDGVRAGYERRFGVRYEVGFSTQDPATDTLAVDAEGRPFRDEAGELLLRPGGHGALIRNLDAIDDAGVVFVKNIDNVQPDRVKPVVVRWKKVLLGLLLRLRGRVHDHLRALRAESAGDADVEAALRFVRESLDVEVADDAVPSDAGGARRWLIDRLDRPLRVCGVVRNTGEPGGGPFWVRGADGTVTPQIVETAQIDPDDEDAQRLLRASTHFNPVDLVCSIADADGEPYDLARFVDEDAVIVARKSAAGRELRALERPGLWNGAMAGWNTVFVEVPLETFSPVKTVLDLLRDEHRSG